jgi:hypothetical protein
LRLALFFLLFAATLFAHDSMPIDVDKLALSEGQAKELKHVFKQFRKDGKAMYKELHQVHEEKEKLLKSDKFDAVQFEKLEEKECRLKSKNKTSFWEAAHRILDEKQIKILYEMYEKGGQW